MSFLSLVTVAESLCCPGALDSALAAPDWMLREFNRDEDSESGANGWRMYIDDLPVTVAEHSRLAPRSAFCRRRVCRRGP